MLDTHIWSIMRHTYFTKAQVCRHLDLGEKIVWITPTTEQLNAE